MKPKGEVAKFKNAYILFFVLFSIVFSTQSCLKLNSDETDQMAANNNRIEQYLSLHNITAYKHSTGFFYEIVSTNPTGSQLQSGDVVEFRYKISLIDGTLIETNFLQEGAAPASQDPDPAYFKLGTYSIIPEGLDIGIKLMKTGERFRFYMPSYLAFGNYRTDFFPANSIFIIDIIVLKIYTEQEMLDKQIALINEEFKFSRTKAVFTESGLCFYDSIPGSGRQPVNYDHVTIDFTRKYLDNTIIKTASDVSFTLNNNEAVAGLEEAIKMMKAGGSAVFAMPSAIGFKHSLCILPEKARKNLLDDKLISAEVKPYSVILYTVKLKSVN